MKNDDRSIIRQIGLIQSKGIVERTFLELLGGDFRRVKYHTPSEYVRKYWSAYLSKGNNSAVVNGKIFELIIETLLYREGILPYYIQARAAFVPNVDFDVLLYAESEPVCLSIKTSLRERYKQADLEAVALKYVHRKALCYLLTLEKNEANSVASKIEKSEVLGLDGLIYCFSDEFDKLIKSLKKKCFTESKTVNVVSGQIVKRIE